MRRASPRSDDQRGLLLIDIDLPEIEDMPQKRVVALKGGHDLQMNQNSERSIPELCAQHVHGVVFRVIGVAFWMLPPVSGVIASGFSQRLTKAPANREDEYLLSVEVPRSEWEKINFGSLEQIDPVLSLERFNLVRRMTTTGIFKPIEPLGAVAASSS